MIEKVREKMKKLAKLLEENRVSFITDENKKFILEFTDKIKTINYDFDGEIGNGFEKGNYQIVYSLNGIHGSRSIPARILIRDNCTVEYGGKKIEFKNGIVLKLYFSNINKHIEYILNAPKLIKERFVNNFGLCIYCQNEEQYECYKRKKWTIDDKEIAKCNDYFEYENPKIKDIDDYIGILKEFYGKKTKNKK